MFYMPPFALLKTFIVIIVGIFSGYFLQKLNNRKIWFSLEYKRKLTIFLQKFAMLGLLSVTYIGSLWVFKTTDISRIITIPFVGIISTIMGGFLAVCYAKFNHYNRMDIGSMFSCGYFSNRTSLGAMICFFYLGETGFALVPIFTFFERLMYFGLGYPIAHMYSKDNISRGKALLRIIEVIKDPFFYIGVGSIIVGILLNISPFKRPVFYGKLNEILIPLTTFILLFSIGLSFKFSQVFKYIKECFYISIIKFLFVPLITFAIAVILGYQTINQGLPLKVSLILSAMPVAFNSVIAANIYKLNIDLVNSCWIFTTLATLFILPLLVFVIEVI